MTRAPEAHARTCWRRPVMASSWNAWSISNWGTPRRRATAAANRAFCTAGSPGMERPVRYCEPFSSMMSNEAQPASSSSMARAETSSSALMPASTTSTPAGLAKFSMMKGVKSSSPESTSALWCPSKFWDEGGMP